MKYYIEPAAPLREVLQAMTGVEPPEFVGPGIYFADDVGPNIDELQSWASFHVKPNWLTGIGLLDAADAQIREAIANANIEGPDCPGRGRCHGCEVWCNRCGTTPLCPEGDCYACDVRRTPLDER